MEGTTSHSEHSAWALGGTAKSGLWWRPSRDPTESSRAQAPTIIALTLTAGGVGPPSAVCVLIPSGIRGQLGSSSRPMIICSEHLQGLAAKYRILIDGLLDHANSRNEDEGLSDGGDGIPF
jgi:hypothetical protein